MTTNLRPDEVPDANWPSATIIRKKTFYGFSRDIFCKLIAVSVFELEDPGTVFDLIKVV